MVIIRKEKTLKKILLITENFPPKDGGSVRWFWELYSRLDPKNVVIAAHNFPESKAFDQHHNLNVIRIPLHSKEWGFRSLSGLKFYWSCFWKLKNLIKIHEISEIHCGRVIHEGVTAWLNSRFLGVPYICYVHGEDIESASTSREQSLLVRQVCKNAKLLVCNSKNSMRLVEELGFEAQAKCRVLNPGVDTNKFIPAIEDNDFKQAMGWSGKQVLLTVGRLQRRKGQDYLVKAMPKLILSNPNLHYAIVGRGECESELRELIRELSLTEHVTMYTDLDDAALIKCYQQCDVFILPNRTIGNDIEGFGMVLAEAQACGKPVIAGRSGGTAETMLEGVTGYVIDCSTPDKLAEELNPLLIEDKMKGFGEIGLIHVKKTLDWQAHVVKALKIFEL
tara:strand:+ start:14207 stop:15382 length:1176 start_codon:yes stop_codon:yes gene_type:complete